MGTAFRRSLEKAVLESGRARQQRAAETVLRDLDQTVPREKGTLAASRRVTNSEAGAIFRTTIEYPGDIPDFLDRGTRAHPIQGRPLLAFFWPKKNATVIVTSVQHPGSRKNVGWFSKPTSDASWRSALQSAR